MTQRASNPPRWIITGTDIAWWQVNHASRTRDGTPMLDLAKELVLYMSARRKWWLAPIIGTLVVVGGLLVLAKASAVAPFIYTVF
jgi:hypothetical protein